MVRSACCDQQEHIKKGAWTKDEDERLISYIKQHGEGSWKSLPKAAGLLRCGKSCKLRWINYLRPDVKRGNFTREEDELIINLQRVIGNKWSLIAARLPGRTDNEIKNHWNTHIKRRLQQRRTCQQPQRENHIGTTMPVYPQHPQQPLPFLMPSGHDIVKFPTVQNCFSTVSNTHDNSVSEFSSSSNSTIAYSDQVTEPAINLELSMSLPLQSDDAMKINDKFKIEKKWELHYPQLFGKSLAASSLSGSIRPAAKESLCLCNSLARGQNNGDKATCSSCTKCASMSRGNADPAANMFYRPMSL